MGAPLVLERRVSLFTLTCPLLQRRDGDEWALHGPRGVGRREQGPTRRATAHAGHAYAGLPAAAAECHTAPQLRSHTIAEKSLCVWSLLCAQYASLSLESRLHTPSSPAAPFEHHQIPSDLAGLQLAIGAAKQQQREGLRPVLLGTPGTATVHLAHHAATRHDAIEPFHGGGGGGPAIQAELARLTFQVDQLREENAQVTAELQAARGVLVGPEAAGGAAGGSDAVPLPLRVQALTAELQDARLRAQQATGVSRTMRHKR